MFKLLISTIMEIVSLRYSFMFKLSLPQKDFASANVSAYIVINYHNHIPAKTQT